MTSDDVDAQRRWAEALSILARTPTESAEEKWRRWRNLRLLSVAAVAVLGAVVAILVVLLVPGPLRAVREPSTGQAVTGVVISGIGVLLSLAGLVAQLRGLRRAGGWRSPMSVLTREQRRELVAQVRGQSIAVPEVLPLARNLAERLVGQRALLVLEAGLLLNFVGQWVLSPSLFRALLAVLFGLVLAAGALFVVREMRRAQRFLTEQPDA